MATNEQSSEEKEPSTMDVSPNPAETREHLLDTAVSFLQNPKVRDGPVTHKKAFLRKKGLTEEEISNVFLRSGTVDHSPQAMVSYPMPHPQLLPNVPVVTSWMRIRETMVAGLLIWGVSKAAHKFYTDYVSPYFEMKRPQERRLEVIENSVLEMQNNLVDTLKKVQDVVVTVQHQQKQMLVLTEQLLKNMPNSGSISLHHNDQTANEIKAELNSIKGLLLSRKQFPNVPISTSSLPAWQLNASTPAAATAVAQSSEAETKAKKNPKSENDILHLSSKQIKTDVGETSNLETTISIEDNKEVDNIFVNGAEGGELSDPQEAQPGKQGSKKSKTKKEETKKKNNLNGFSTDQPNKVDKSHVI